MLKNSGFKTCEKRPRKVQKPRFQGEIVAKTVKKGIKKGAEAPFLML